MSDIPERKPVAEGRDAEVGGIPLTTLPPEMRVNMGRRQVNAMLLLAALAVPYSAVRAQLTEPPYLVTDFDWVDQARSRPVPARLYWPTAATSEMSVPLVVFSHGIGGSRQGYSYLGKHWSARGVASLHVQHVGSDAALWRAVGTTNCKSLNRSRTKSHRPFKM